MFKDERNDIAYLNKQFGLQLTEAHSPSQALTAYLEVKGVKLECNVPQLKTLSAISDDDSLKIACTALFSPQIEDWNDSEVWLGDGDEFTPNECTLQIGVRCFEATLRINPEEGTINLYDDENELIEIHNVASVVDCIRSLGIAFNFNGLSVSKQVDQGLIFLKEVTNG